MKIAEILSLCDEADNRAYATGKFSIVIPGYRNGDRCRVAPGLMGNFLSHVGGEGRRSPGTLVELDSGKVRKWLEKHRAELEQGEVHNG